MSGDEGDHFLARAARNIDIPFSPLITSSPYLASAPRGAAAKTWMRGTSPRMTELGTGGGRRETGDGTRSWGTRDGAETGELTANS